MDKFTAAQRGEVYGDMVRSSVIDGATAVVDATQVATTFVYSFFGALFQRDEAPVAKQLRLK